MASICHVFQYRKFERHGHSLLSQGPRKIFHRPKENPVKTLYMKSYYQTKALGTDLRWGGGGAKIFLYHTYISKGYSFVHKYICQCDFNYSLSYGPILALLLCTDLYIVILNSIIFFGWHNIGVGATPPAPTAMQTLQNHQDIDVSKHFNPLPLKVPQN